MKWLAVVALVCAVLGALAGWDPFHLRLAEAATGVLVLAALVLGTVLAARALPGRVLRVAGAAVGGLLVAGWLGLAALTVAFAGPEPEQVAAVGGDDGRVELVLVRGHAFEAPVYSVRLRAGGGPFAQESLVWQGLADAPAPTRLVLSGPQEVRVVASGVCGYRSTFDRTTLAVEPVHYALRPDGC